MRSGGRSRRSSPPGRPSSTSRCVDAHSSTKRYGRPRRPREQRLDRVRDQVRHPRSRLVPAVKGSQAAAPRGTALDYEKLSDPILVTRAKDGDRDALEALCSRHAPKVERLARHLLRDPEDASDAAQEALAKLCVRLRQFRGDSQFSTWLHRLVVNTCRDAAERQQDADARAARRRISAPISSTIRRATSGMSELRRELCDSLAGISPEQAQVDRPQGRARLLVRGDRRARPACPSGRRSVTRIAGATACASGSKTATSREPPARPVRPGRDRVAHPAPAAVPARRRDPRARAGQARRRAAPDPRGRLVVPGPLPRAAGDAGRPHDRGDRAGRRRRGARRRGEPGQDPVLRGHRRLPLQARRRAGRRARRSSASSSACAGRSRRARAARSSATRLAVEATLTVFVGTNSS